MTVSTAWGFEMGLRTVLLGVVLAAATASAGASRPHVVVLPLAQSDASLKQLSETLSEQILTELGKTKRVDAMGSSDIASVLGLERQKEMLGCTTSDSTCLAELSAALGANFIVTGAVGRLGKALRIDLKLIRTRDGVAVYRDGQNTKEEAELFEVVTRMVKDMVAQGDFSAAGTTGGNGVGAQGAAPAGAGPGIAPWLAVGAGALLAVGGGVVSAGAASEWSNLHSAGWKAAHTSNELTATASAYGRDVWVGPALLGVGLAGVAVGLAWWKLGGADPASPKVAIVPTLNGFAIGGQL